MCGGEGFVHNSPSGFWSRELSDRIRNVFIQVFRPFVSCKAARFKLFAFCPFSKTISDELSEVSNHIAVFVWEILGLTIHV